MIMTRTRPGGGPEDFRTRRPVCRPRFRRVRAARAHRPAGGLVTPGPPSPGRVRWRSPPGGDSESGKLAAAAPGRGGPVTGKPGCHRSRRSRVLIRVRRTRARRQTRRAAAVTAGVTTVSHQSRGGHRDYHDDHRDRHGHGDRDVPGDGASSSLRVRVKNPGRG